MPDIEKKNVLIFNSWTASQVSSIVVAVKPSEEKNGKSLGSM